MVFVVSGVVMRSVVVVVVVVISWWVRWDLGVFCVFIEGMLGV